MGNPSRAWGAFLLAACLATAGRSAHAGVVELPTSRLDVDLPYKWTVTGGDHASRLDLLHADGEGDIRVGAATLPCADVWEDTAKTATLEVYAPSWLPSGWEARRWGGNHYGFCRWLGTFGIGVTFHSDDVDTWPSDNDFVTLLGVLERSTLRSTYGQRDTPITLPGTGLALQLPMDTFLDSSSPGDRKDVLVVDANGATARLEVYRSSDRCDVAAAAKAPGAIQPKSYYAGKGWNTYDLVGGPDRRVYCTDDTGTTIVVVGATEAEADATGNPLAEDFVLSGLHGELEPAPSLGEPQTLPASGWKLRAPDGWEVNPVHDGGVPPEDGKDRLEDPESMGMASVTFERSTAPCASLAGPNGLSFMTSYTYDPLWLPSGWTAATSPGFATDFCATVDGASLHLTVDGMDSGMRRRLLVALLVDLVSLNTPAVVDTTSTTSDTSTSTYASSSSHPRRPLLPWPVDVSLQTLAVGSDRGWGARVGLGASKYLNRAASVGARGELGLDSANHLSYDLGADLALRLGNRLYLVGLGGLDQYGSVDQQQVASALYGGVGGRYGLYERDGHVGLEVAYVWRGGSDGTDPAYPSHEWRVGADLLWYTRKLLTGLSVQYRGAGDANVVAVGVKLHL